MGRVRAGYDSRTWHGRLEQIVEIRQGRRKQIVAVGDIDVTRDFTNVHDVVNAYFALPPSGSPVEVYNICSRHEASIRAVLERLRGMGRRQKRDRARLHNAEQRRTCGSLPKLRRVTRRVAATPLDDSLADMLRCWENRERDWSSRH